LLARLHVLADAVVGYWRQMRNRRPNPMQLLAALLDKDAFHDVPFQLLLLLVAQLQGTSPQQRAAFLYSPAGSSVMRVVSEMRAEEALMSGWAMCASNNRAVAATRLQHFFQGQGAWGSLEYTAGGVMERLVLPGLLLQPVPALWPPWVVLDSIRAKLGIRPRCSFDDSSSGSLGSSDDRGGNSSSSGGSRSSGSSAAGGGDGAADGDGGRGALDGGVGFVVSSCSGGINNVTGTCSPGHSVWIKNAGAAISLLCSVGAVARLGRGGRLLQSCLCSKAINVAPVKVQAPPTNILAASFFSHHLTHWHQHSI
jgi:hypothetical protein